MSKNIPIDVIANFNTLGDVKPMWIRVADENHELHTVSIEGIQLKTKTNYAGFQALNFNCKITMKGQEHSILLKYLPETQKWFLI